MVSPSKTYSTKESNYPPGDTVKKIYKKSTITTVLTDYSSAVIACCARSYSPSPKLGPQGQRKAEEYPKVDGITPDLIAGKVESSNKVRGYVTEIREDKQNQKVIVNIDNTYKYEFVIYANKVAWV